MAQSALALLVLCAGGARGLVVPAATPRLAARRAGVAVVAQAKPELMNVDEDALAAGPAVDPETGEEVENDFVRCARASRAGRAAPAAPRRPRTTARAAAQVVPEREGA